MYQRWLERKVVWFQLSQNEFDLGRFQDMDTAVLPRAAAVVSQGGGVPDIYRLAGNVPSLFECLAIGIPAANIDNVASSNGRGWHDQ